MSDPGGGRRGLGGRGLHVGLHDLAGGAGTLDSGQIHAHLLGHPAGQRGCLEVLIGDPALEAGALDLGQGGRVDALVLDQLSGLGCQFQRLHVHRRGRGRRSGGGRASTGLPLSGGSQGGIRILPRCAGHGDGGKHLGEGPLLQNDLQEGAVLGGLPRAWWSCRC